MKLRTIQRQPRNRRARRGFTLIEAAMTTVIVGVGILSSFQLFAALTQQNAMAQRLSTAIFLADNVQEAIADLPFRDVSGPSFGLEPDEGTAPVSTAAELNEIDDMDDFDGFDSRLAVGAPIDSRRQRLLNLTNFSQRVTVQHVSPDVITRPELNTRAVRVEVTIYYRQNGQDGELHKISWVRLRD